MLPFAARPRLLPPAGEDDDARQKPDSAPLPGDPYGLSAGVGRDAPNRRDDVLRVETVLSRLGRFDATPTGGPTGYPGMRLVESLTGLQKDHGLTVDGRALPGGETLGAMRTEDVARGGAGKPVARPAVYRPGRSDATMKPANLLGQVPNPAFAGKMLGTKPNLLHRTAAEWPISPKEALQRNWKRAREDMKLRVQQAEKRDIELAREKARRRKEWLQDDRNLAAEVMESHGVHVELDLIKGHEMEIAQVVSAISRLPEMNRDYQRDRVFEMIRAFDRPEFGNLAHQLTRAANYQLGQANSLPGSLDEAQLEDNASFQENVRQFFQLLGIGMGAAPRAGTAASTAMGAASTLAKGEPYQRELDRRRKGYVDPKKIYPLSR